MTHQPYNEGCVCACAVYAYTFIESQLVICRFYCNNEWSEKVSSNEIFKDNLLPVSFRLYL